MVGCGAPAVQGLARVGDLARTFDRVQGFWEPGDLGVVVREDEEEKNEHCFKKE